jgi:hypothetical protein
MRNKQRSCAKHFVPSKGLRLTTQRILELDSVFILSRAVRGYQVGIASGNTNITAASGNKIRWSGGFQSGGYKGYGFLGSNAL